MKILMVCLGNICRSPLAEGILQSKVENGIFVESAGTSAFHAGEKPDKRSIAVAKKYGIDISSQRSKQFQITDFDTYDIIYAMDRSNYQNIIRLSRNENDIQKVKMICENDIPDPYYGGDNGFEMVYQMLNNACESIVTKINKNEQR